MFRSIAHDISQPILNIDGLSVSYGDHPVLERITFHLHIGERVAVVGPNGAGKSTLFKVIAGVIPPTSGNVNVYGSSSGKHTCIAYIPQRSQVDWHFPVTVYDVVMMGRTSRIGLFKIPDKTHQQAVSRALETVEMQDLSRRSIHQLSGGQQQRMFIARALAQEAELMLMDEPLSGLDDPAQEALLVLLQKLERERVTIMVATHDLNQAASYFNRIMLLNRRLVRFGASQEVLTPELLKVAYGGRLSVLQNSGSTLALDQSCCGGEDDA